MRTSDLRFMLLGALLIAAGFYLVYQACMNSLDIIPASIK